jgi:WD40 repeat protein
MRSARSVRLLGPTVFEGAVPVSVAFSPKRSHDIAAVAGGRLLFFDLRSERVILDEARCAIDVLDDGSSYSYGEEEEEEEDADAEVEVGEEASDADDDEINAVSYSPDGAFVATADDGGEINVFERRRGGSDWARRACIVGHDNIASAAAWCPAAPRRAVAGGLSPLPPFHDEADGARAYDAAVAAQNLHRPRILSGDTGAEQAVKRRDNRSAIPDKGKSRFVGVSWSKQHKKWWKYE